MSKKLKLAVLISGRGSNLKSLIAACSEKDFPAEIVVVISNRPDAKGLEYAKDAGIKTEVVDHKKYKFRVRFEEAMQEKIKKSGAELVCLAGFMRLLTKWFVEQWEDRIINIHPSLLPAFPGTNVQEKAIKAGVKFSGCTVHFVRPEMDSGPIIIQSAVPVYANDKVEDLEQRILKSEHICYPLAVRMIAEGGVEIKDEVVHIKGQKKSEEFIFNPTK